MCSSLIFSGNIPIFEGTTQKQRCCEAHEISQLNSIQFHTYIMVDRISFALIHFYNPFLSIVFLFFFFFGLAPSFQWIILIIVYLFVLRDIRNSHEKASIKLEPL